MGNASELKGIAQVGPVLEVLFHRPKIEAQVVTQGQDGEKLPLGEFVRRAGCGVLGEGLLGGGVRLSGDGQWRTAHGLHRFPLWISLEGIGRWRPVLEGFQQSYSRLPTLDS